MKRQLNKKFKVLLPWTQMPFLVASSLLPACTTLKSVFITDTGPESRSGQPIHNPFGDYYANAKNEQPQPIILRTKKGDRAVEVELPSTAGASTDFTIPIAPAFSEPGRSGASRGLASVSGRGPAAMTDDSYLEHRATTSDREIASEMPQGSTVDDGSRRDIEKNLGLMTSQDDGNDHDQSYLAGVDHVKQLYVENRIEAALIETDGLVDRYQTDPRLYEMRGTLLERIGKPDLALKSWNQALRLNPGDQALRKFVERKQAARGVASK